MHYAIIIYIYIVVLFLKHNIVTCPCPFYLMCAVSFLSLLNVGFEMSLVDNFNFLYVSDV